MGISQDEHTVCAPNMNLISANIDYHSTIIQALTTRQVQHAAALGALAACSATLVEAAIRLVATLRAGRKVLVAGNGGSAAEAQHFAAELVGRFKREREPYAVLALTTDTSILTSIANDYGYQNVFARQVRAFGQPDDLLITFSTSGESENLVYAARAGRQRNMLVVAVTGERQSRLGRLADVVVRVPSADTALVQELHMVVTHILCDIVEQQVATPDYARSDDAQEKEQRNEQWEHSAQKDEWQP